jgi:hypothetical protein
MYFDFDFDRDSEFFNQSPSFKLVQQQLNDEKRLASIDKKIVNATVKLWAECVLKNNLDINAHRIDPIYLISEQNSTEIFNIFGKIMWKEKDKRTDKDRQILKEQDRVNNCLQLYLFDFSDDKIDIFSDLKKEFTTWKFAQELSQEMPSNPTKTKNKKL